ncbi:MAG TPA: ABC transporter permease [Candidatus Dormibacteraeota bacterium]|nr:ABC transporter permease [Candidatus Dormibacteraeota bacterium]
MIETAGAHQRARRSPRVHGGHIGAALVVLTALAALVSLIYTPHSPYTMHFEVRLAGPTPAHPLGTDQFGRDIASRLMVGARTALLSGIVAVGVASLLGTTIGVLAGFVGGLLDEALMRVMDALYAFPALLLALLFAAIAQPGLVSAMLAIGLAGVPIFGRLARASIYSLRALPYAEAARAVGATPARVLLRHLLPNAMGPLIVQATQSFALAILAEAALSFLGLGVQPPFPSWGSMLREAQSFLPLSPYPALWPGLAIALTVLGFSLLGDALRDRLDPHHR